MAEHDWFTPSTSPLASVSPEQVPTTITVTASPTPAAGQPAREYSHSLGYRVQHPRNEGKIFGELQVWHGIIHGVTFVGWMLLILCNVLIPQLLWLRRVRASATWLFLLSCVVLTGMWLERFVIVMSLTRDYVPSAWGQYSPSVWDWATFIGTLGLFLALLFLFIRFLPMISISEMRQLLPESQVRPEEPAEDRP